MTNLVWFEIEKVGHQNGLIGFPFHHFFVLIETRGRVNKLIFRKKNCTCLGPKLLFLELSDP